MNGLEGVVVGDTESRECRQADGKEKYAGQHSEGKRGSLVRVTKVGTKEKSKGQVPKHSSCGRSRMEAAVRVDFSPYPADWERCWRLEGAHSTVHGIDNVLVAYEDGNTQIDSSACGGVGAGDGRERGGQDDGENVGKDDEGENQSVEGEEVPETPTGLSAQLWRELPGTSEPLELALVDDDGVLDLLAKRPLLFRNGRREERRFDKR
jgi:hypothetical protein